MNKENDKKCKWTAPNGQQYDCKPSPVCGDCENNTFSENRQYRIVGSSYADIAENRIVELETELTKRAEQIEALNKDKDYFSDALDKQIEATYKVVEKLNEAKDIIKKIEKTFYSGENAIKRLSKISDILKEAEKFIKE